MRVLCLSLPSDDLGLPSRLLPIAAELRKRHHEVAFANPAPAPTKLIASAGFENLPVVPVSVVPKGVPPATPRVRDLDHLMALLGYCDPAFTAAEVARWTNVIQRWRPDVVFDSIGVAPCAAARVAGVPIVEVLQGDFHPDGPGLTWWLPPEPAPTPVDAFNEVLVKAKRSPVDRAARLLLGDVTLVVGSRATDPVPDASLTHVGSLAWGRADDALPAGIPPARGRPLVFLYSGKARYRPGMTFWADSAVVAESTLAAVADMDVDVVLAGGYQALPTSIPANVTVLEFAPGQALARRADVFVHHGGHGSTLTGLTAGTPALVIPTFSERESNGRRTALLGAGLCLVPDERDGERVLMPSTVAAALHRLFTDMDYRTSATRAGDDLAALAGAAAVVEAVERVGRG